MYHSVYLLNRAPGFPSCGEVKRRRAIQEILSSLQERPRMQTSSADAEDAPGNEMHSAPPLTYEAALQVACWKVVETATSLQSDLDRLDNELRGRPWACSQAEAGTEHNVEDGVEHGPEAAIECDLGVKTELEPEVYAGNVLRVGLRTGEEPKLKIIIRLTPKMDGPIPRTVSGNP